MILSLAPPYIRDLTLCGQQVRAACHRSDYGDAVGIILARVRWEADSEGATS